MDEIINERYRINRELGRGGMAVVYDATDLLLDRQVALKMLKEEYASDDDFIERLKLEARAVARINHPNVVNIYDISQQEGSYYLVMENIAGKNLKDIISRRGKIPVIEALDVASQICSALMVAHKNNIVHCDIKPHNIIITPLNQVKVTDFGIARAVSSSTKHEVTSSIEGSAHYFSPEQAQGAEITPLSDIYSLGVVLYEMLTGQLPFTGKTAVNVALKHIKEKPENIKLREENVPEEVENVIMTALAKNPQDRYQNAQKMRDAIKTVLTSIREREQQKQEEKDNNLAKTLIHDKSAEKIRAELNEDQDKERQETKSFASREQSREREELGSRAGEDKKREAKGNKQANKGRNRKKQKLVKRARLIFTLTIIFAGLLLISYFTYSVFMDVPIVEVPDVTGYDLREAENILQEKGFNYTVAENKINHAEIEENHVANQSPSAGDEVRQTRDINLVLSAGPEYVEVPDLESLNLREARIVLEGRGLTVGEEKYDFSDEYPQDIVIGSDPPAGEEITEGSEVDIIVSQGRSPYNF